MPIIGEFIRMDKEKIEKFQKGKSSLCDFLDDMAGKTENNENFLNVDGAWHAIHFTLSGAVWDNTNNPLSKIIISGTPVNNEDVGYGPAMLITNDEIHIINKALKTVTRDSFRKNFSLSNMLANEIYPVYHEGGDEDKFFDFVYSYLKKIKSFFKEAKRDKQDILFYTH